MTLNGHVQRHHFLDEEAEDGAFLERNLERWGDRFVPKDENYNWWHYWWLCHQEQH